jgi:hypothetical protein
MVVVNRMALLSQGGLLVQPLIYVTEPIYIYIYIYIYKCNITLFATAFLYL